MKERITNFANKVFNRQDVLNLGGLDSKISLYSVMYFWIKLGKIIYYPCLNLVIK